MLQLPPLDQQQPLLANCWACRTLIQVPFDSQIQQPAELFKCGWCGAINSLLQQQQQQQQQQQSHHAAAAPIFSWVVLAAQHALRPLHWLAVACVLLLVGSIGGLGVAHLLPLVCTSMATYAPNLVLVFTLTWCVVGHYCAAVCLHPGAVADLYPDQAALFAADSGGSVGSGDPVSSSDYVAAGSFDCWSWCRRCRQPKPPRTHHCRRCRTCVVGLDHHCVMLANCVGAANMRPFLLFLLWALAAAVYILCMVAILMTRRRHEIAAAVTATRAAHRHSVGMQGAGAGAGQQQRQQTAAASPPGLWLLGGPLPYFLLAAAPLWVLEAIFLISVSVGVLLGLGMLLGSQLYYLGLGHSYIDSLQQQQQQQHLSTPPSVGRLALLGRAARRLGAVLLLLPQDNGRGGWRTVIAALFLPGWRCKSSRFFFLGAGGSKSKAT